MPLSPGTRFESYVIVSAVGAGGMGEVYRAQDTKLGRDVAVKVLPGAFTTDPERLSRFAREARVLASLNHPNIAAIHGLEESNGTSAIIMELVDGPTLADRIDTRMSVDEALGVAKQIAAALEAAHAAGVIHRDLKPANIKVRPDGVVKVLDFGLAKALAQTGSDATTLMTETGVIMGTPAYMSPEQARGETIDQQADIWSFGAVLYEMLTGVSPFRRATSADTLAAVVGQAPDYSFFPSTVPASARRLVRRCLERDRSRRLKHAGDVRIEVEDALAAIGAGPEPGGAVNQPKSRPWWPAAAAAIALVAAAAAGGWWVAGRSASPRPGIVRLFLPTGGSPFRNVVGSRNLEISADGSRVAYASSTRLWMRRMDQPDEVSVQEGGFNPFFSPDGQWLGFATTTGLSKVSVHGGIPSLIAATAERSGGATWGRDGTIVFATTEGLYRVSENGGPPRLVARPDSSRKERAYSWPRFMPDGQSVLFTIVPEGSIDGAQIAAVDLNSGRTRVVLKGGTAARYVPPGRLVYASGQRLKAIAFDPGTLEVSGEPVTLPGIDVATAADNGAAEFAVSDSGTLVFVAREQTPEEARTLTWVDRRGQEDPLPLAPGAYQYARISPDGTRLAVDMLGVNRDIWIWNFQRPSLTKLTDGPTEDLLPIWSVDGTRIFFASDRAGNFDIYSQAADGATPARVEFSSPGTQMPVSLTPDGSGLLLVENFTDLGVVSLAHPNVLERPFHDGRNHWVGEVSPDGKWIAYESDESGTQMDIYLRPYPDVNGRREKISIDGGRYPHWGPGGRELFYQDLNGNMMSAEVSLSPGLRLGRVVKLFQWYRPSRSISGRPYDTSPTDGRFLMVKLAATGSSGAPVNISVVLNWLQELRERLPGR